MIKTIAWRRHYDKRIIKKRLKILRSCWGDLFYFSRMKDQSGKLRKWNLACSCGMCNIQHKAQGGRSLSIQELKEKEKNSDFL